MSNLYNRKWFALKSGPLLARTSGKSDDPNTIITFITPGGTVLKNYNSKINYNLTTEELDKLTYYEVESALLGEKFVDEDMDKFINENQHLVSEERKQELLKIRGK